MYENGAGDSVAYNRERNGSDNIYEANWLKRKGDCSEKIKKELKGKVEVELYVREQWISYGGQIMNCWGFRK